MFLLFDVANQSSILNFIPESLEVLIFGICLILLALGLRTALKRGEANVPREVEKGE